MEKTVLILGAGFSKPYGYPDGRELIQNIVSYGNKTVHGYSFGNISSDLAHDDEESIDSFLSKHPKHKRSGIAAIALEILKCEKSYLGKKVNAEHDVIKYLLNNIREENFENCKIITFNYDRHLEWRLDCKLMATYQDANKVSEITKKLKIYHVHGQMLPLLNHNSVNPRFAPYGLTEDSRAKAIQEMYAIDHAIDNFKTIYSADPNPDSEIVAAIKEARRVFFLGFAFHDLNMKKLGINVSGINYDWKNKVVAGTALDVKTVNRSKIKERYNFLTDDQLLNTNCKEFFESYYCITDKSHDTYKKEVLSCCHMNANQGATLPSENSGDYLLEFNCLTCGSNKKANFIKENSDAKWRLRTVF